MTLNFYRCSKSLLHYFRVLFANKRHTQQGGIISKKRIKNREKRVDKMAQPKAEISIVPADENDALILAQIESMAFDGPSAYALNRTNTAGVTETASDKEQPLSLNRLMFGLPSAEGYAIRARGINERLKTSPDYHIYKAVLKEGDAPEKIVGFAAWRFCADAPFPAEDTWKDLPWEGAANPTVCNDFFGGMAKLRTKNLGGKKVACTFLSLSLSLRLSME